MASHAKVSSSSGKSAPAKVSAPSASAIPTASGHGGSAAAVAAAAADAKKFKKFTHAQIKEKVDKRRTIKNYYELLMDSAVREDDDGVVFDSTHPSWKALLRAVELDTAANGGGTTAAVSVPASRPSLPAPTPPQKAGVPRAPSSSPPSSAVAPSPQTTSSSNNNTSGGISDDDREWVTLTPQNEPATDGGAEPPTPLTLSAQALGVLHGPTSPASPPVVSGMMSIRPDLKSAPATPLSVASTPTSRNRTDSTNSNTDGERAEIDDEFLDEDTARREMAEDGKLLAQLHMELKEKQPDVFIVRQACQMVGIPDEHRTQIWQILLKQYGSSDTSIPDDYAKLDQPNQRVIKVDIERTLPHIARFQEPQVRHDMEVLLTEYCRHSNISYKQGMNYVMAPFWMINLPNRSQVYNCYTAFIQRFLPNTYTDSEFGGLQCVFALFRFLLLYHDPELSQWLDQLDLGPELYASSWFITLYSNRTKPDVLLHLWDLLLLESEDDPLLHYFFSLALLISHRKKLLAEDMVTLPEVLSRLTVNSKKEVSYLMQKARRTYRAQTANSTRSTLKSFTSRTISPDSPEYTTLLSLPCLGVSADEILRHCYGSDIKGKNDSKIKFFILDCRPLSQYEAGHLPLAYHLDPDLLTKPDKLAKRVESLVSMKGCHFCFFAEGEGPTKSQSSTMLNLYFLQKGFKYISNCEGGYEVCHSLIVHGDKGYELVDHNTAKCLECIRMRNRRNQKKPAGGSKKAGGFLSTIGGGMKKLLSGATDAAGKALEAKEVYSEDYRQANTPDSVWVLPVTPQLRLLHTVLRNKTVHGKKFSSCVNRLVSLVAAAALDRVPTRDHHVITSSNGSFTGLQTTPICAISVSTAGELALRSALKPYQPAISPAVGKMSVDKSMVGQWRTPASKDQPVAGAKKRGSMDGDVPAVVSGGPLLSLSTSATPVNGPMTTPSSSPPPLSTPLSPTSPAATSMSSFLASPSSTSSSVSSSTSSNSLSSSSSSSSSSAPSVSRSKSSTSVAPTKQSQVKFIVTLPDDVTSRHIFLLIPLLSPINTLDPDATDCVGELVKRGIAQSSITVLAIIAARSSLWSLADRYPDITIIVSSVDELSSGQLLPGLKHVEERYLSTTPQPFVPAPIVVPTNGGSGNGNGSHSNSGTPVPLSSPPLTTSTSSSSISTTTQST